MAQQERIGNSQSSSTGGNIFGSNFGTETANANFFGEQSNPTANIFEAFSGQTGHASTHFGSFEGHTNEKSIFGSASGMNTEGYGTDLFGKASNVPVFGGQASSSLPNSSGTSSTIFGSNLGFGSFATTGHSGQPFISSTASHVFGTPSSVSASNPFVSSQSSLLFSSGNQPSSPLFAGSISSSTGIPFGSGQLSFTQPAFSLNQTPQSNTDLSTSSSSLSFPTQSASVFGSVTSGSVFGTLPPSSGIRKRDSSGAVSGSALFGKQSAQAGGSDSVSTSAHLFTMKQNVPSLATNALFSGAAPSMSHSGMMFPNTSTRDQLSGSNTLFGQKHSDMSKTEISGSEKVLFGKPQPEPEQTVGPIFQTAHSIGGDPNTTKLHPSTISASEGALSTVKEDYVSSNTLFGDHDFGSLQSQKRSGHVGAYKKPGGKSSVKTALFGKPLQPTGGLFGKAMLSLASTSDKDQALGNQGVFGKNQGPTDLDRNKTAGLGGTASSSNLIQHDKGDNSTANSSQKSLSRWTHGKVLVNSDRKRGVSSLPADSPGDRSTFSPTVRGRSSSIRLSVDDLTSKNSIIVKDIPAHLNRGPILRRHFSRFGTITRLQPLAAKRAANITFRTHEEAAAAKNEGKYLLPEGPPMSIFWRASSKVKSPDEKLGQGREHTSRAKVMPGSVEDELASMAELADFQDFPVAPKQHDLPESAPVRKRSPTPPPAAPVLDIDVAKGLLKTIYRARPKDTTEKVAVLDAKDRLLKLLRGRQQSDLATAKAFVGTCPDMCPEKERYYREDIRRLAVYEVIPSTLTSLTGLKSKVDHCRAVKEYSRSSADQEEPLPYELRPLHVLVTTMSYLLSQVANLGEEGKWSEWYDFLWNRTRGIRKDITQQQLCDIRVAELLEKCARFHIFCSERLCEEGMMSFDAKINNENLTKCLQTLKELYADLEKRGVVCPNEAEFRGYMVLMNLNEGDILREIQQMRPGIRDSPHIGFAVQVYNALNTNNYVRFFRLIEEKATFLSACILHRYFNQIRSKALLIIMKAHGALGKTIILYPIEEMIRLLCFEDAREVEAFCFHYCLSLKGTDVVLDAKAYAEPEGSLPQTRSQSLIEIKQENVSIGEVINGSPLPPFLQMPTPSSSFDQDGFFIMSSDIQEALDSSKLFKPKVVTSVEEVKVQEKLVHSNEVVKSLARILIIEVIDDYIKEIAKNVVQEETDLSNVIMSVINDVVGSSLDDALRQIAQEEYEEQESKLRRKLEEELVARRQSACSNLCDEMVHDTVAVMSKQVAEEEMSLVTAELHCQCLERCSQQCSDDMLCQVIDEMTEDIAMEVYDVDVVMKRERLKVAEQLVMLIRCRRFLQAWRMKYVAQLRVKRAMLDFPSAPSGTSLREQLCKLMPTRPDSRISQRSFYIGERAKLCIKSPMEVIQDELQLNVQLSMASARHMLTNLMMWRPLDMTQTVNSQLQRAFQTWKDEGCIDPHTATLQWKLVISVPNSESLSSSGESTFVKWIRTKLCRSADRETILHSTSSYEGEVLSLCQLTEDGQKQLAVPAGLCIRCFHGTWTDNQEISVKKKDLLKGTSAVLFILPCAENRQVWNQSSQHPAWKKQRQRLHQILNQKPETPAIPLVLVIPRLLSTNSVSLKLLDDNLELSGLYEQKLISTVHAVQPFIDDQEHPLKCFGEWTTMLTDCLRFAASNIPAPPKLRAKPVSDYMEDVIVEFYKTSVYQDLRSRIKKQLLHQSPNTLLSLYNEVVAHAAMVCASSSLGQMSWPAPEFDQSLTTGRIKSVWNTEAYMCDLYELVGKMRLPYFRYSNMEADDWSTACQDVWSYVALVTKKDSGISTKIYLHQQVAELLSRCKKTFHQFCWLAHKDGPCEPTYINTPWTDLIDACIHYKMVSLRTGLISLRKDEHEDDDELAEEDQEFEEVMVYYQESELEDWEAPRIWFEAVRDTETAEPGHLKSTVERAAEVKRDETVADSMETSGTDETPAEVTPSCMTAQLTSSVTDNETSSSLTSLKMILEQERAASEKFEKALESCLSPTTTSFEQESRKDTSAMGLFLSPIKSDKKTSSQEGQHFNLPDRTQIDRFNVSETFRKPRQSPLHLKGSSPGNFNRQPISLERDSEQVGAAGVSQPFNLSSTLSERMTDLQHTILSEKQANVLLEMRMRSFLDEV